ncbi:Ankyrin repeat protein [Giardia duodenalis]|uniref:Ankyrin repeat protein n=1 Tax=Giardia intestinalis TaxID=5741 RepID=V6TDD0_GIAIN|nr:Ankyrin repeat protein [Giardia intestinalis]
MSSADDSDHCSQECDRTLPPTPENDTDDEYMSEDIPTESSEMDGEDGVDEDGVTELMKAARRNDVDAVKRYIPQQAGMVAKFFRAGGVNIYEGTALMVAAVLGHAEVVKLLRKHESGMMSSDKHTALMWAAVNGHTEVVRLLVEVEGGMKRSEGWTALVGAASSGHLECVKLLLEKEKDVGGEVALYMASTWGNSEVVSFLKSKGIVDPYLQMLSRKAVSERA